MHCNGYTNKAWKLSGCSVQCALKTRPQSQLLRLFKNTTTAQYSAVGRAYVWINTLSPAVGDTASTNLKCNWIYTFRWSSFALPGPFYPCSYRPITDCMYICTENDVTLTFWASTCPLKLRTRRYIMQNINSYVYVCPADYMYARPTICMTGRLFPYNSMR